ncbi:MAG: HYR domain-containing protein, partial [Bacteroidota bacterium]
MDYSSGVVQVAGLPSGSTFPIGVTTNTFIIEDTLGNIAICSFNVTITDTTVPVITSCPADITANNDTGACEAMVTIPMPTVTDNCGNIIRESTGRIPFNFNADEELADTPATITNATTLSNNATLLLRYSGDFSINSSVECFLLNGPDGSQIYFECNVGNTCDIVERIINIPIVTWNGW